MSSWPHAVEALVENWSQRGGWAVVLVRFPNSLVQGTWLGCSRLWFSWCFREGPIMATPCITKGFRTLEAEYHSTRRAFGIALNMDMWSVDDIDWSFHLNIWCFASQIRPWCHRLLISFHILKKSQLSSRKAISFEKYQTLTWLAILCQSLRFVQLTMTVYIVVSSDHREGLDAWECNKWP